MPVFGSLAGMVSVCELSGLCLAVETALLFILNLALIQRRNLDPCVCWLAMCLVSCACLWLWLWVCGSDNSRLFFWSAVKMSEAYCYKPGTFFPAGLPLFSEGFLDFYLLLTAAPAPGKACPPFWQPVLPYLVSDWCSMSQREKKVSRKCLSKLFLQKPASAKRFASGSFFFRSDRQGWWHARKRINLFK